MSFSLSSTSSLHDPIDGLHPINGRSIELSLTLASPCHARFGHMDQLGSTELASSEKRAQTQARQGPVRPSACTQTLDSSSATL